MSVLGPTVSFTSCDVSVGWSNWWFNPEAFYRKTFNLIEQSSWKRSYRKSHNVLLQKHLHTVLRNITKQSKYWNIRTIWTGTEGIISIRLGNLSCQLFNSINQLSEETFDKIFWVEYSVITFDLSYQFDRPTETSRDIKVIMGSESSVSGLPWKNRLQCLRNVSPKCMRKVQMQNWNRIVYSEKLISKLLSIFVIYFGLLPCVNKNSGQFSASVIIWFNRHILYKMKIALRD